VSMKKYLRHHVAAALAVACFAASPASAALKKVTLLQPVPAIDIRNAPWAVAQEMGWLADGGIHLDIQFAKGSVVVIQQIMAGNAQYGMPPPEPAVIALSKGGAVKFFFASTTKSPFPLVVLENSPIKSLGDLKGKTIGLHSITAVQYFTTQSILRSVGLKLPDDFNFVEVGAGPAALKALQDGQIAALATNIFNYGGFESRGVKFRYMTSPEVEPIFAWGLMTTPAYLKENEKEAVHLARAFAMGNVFCRAKPEECVRIFLKRFPTVRSPGISEEQAISDQLRILAKFNEYAPQAPGKPWGWYDAAAWKGVVDYMVASGQLPQAIDPSPLYTNGLLDQINAFDAESVTTGQAR
jgi:NitT/TauT family transport system substrate-binding protein